MSETEQKIKIPREQYEAVALSGRTDQLHKFEPIDKPDPNAPAAPPAQDPNVDGQANEPDAQPTPAAAPDTVGDVDATEATPAAQDTVEPGATEDVQETIEQFEGTERKKDAAGQYLYKIKVYGEDQWVPFSGMTRFKQTEEAQNARWREIDDADKKNQQDREDLDTMRDSMNLFGLNNQQPPPRQDGLNDDLFNVDDTGAAPSAPDPELRKELAEVRGEVNEIKGKTTFQVESNRAFGVVEGLINKASLYMPIDRGNRVYNQVIQESRGALDDAAKKKLMDPTYIFDAYTQLYESEIAVSRGVGSQDQPPAQPNDSAIRPPKTPLSSTKRKSDISNELKNLQAHKDMLMKASKNPKNNGQQGEIGAAMQDVNNRIKLLNSQKGE